MHRPSFSCTNSPTPRAHRGHRPPVHHHPKRTHARTVRGRASTSSWAGQPVWCACQPYAVVPDYSRVVRPALSLWALVGSGTCDDVPGRPVLRCSLPSSPEKRHACAHPSSRVGVASSTRGVACNHACILHLCSTLGRYCLFRSNVRP
jgi:hypothetical protein